jgi:hypothetical protein
MREDDDMATTEPMVALREVVARLEEFRRGGALRHEGGERALRGFLITGFFMGALAWPWHRLVLGESIDLLAVDWRDQPVFCVETKSPYHALLARHRDEIASRLDRWDSFRFAVLTNGTAWERFDDLTQRPLRPSTTLELQRPITPEAFLAPMHARRYLPELP